MKPAILFRNFHKTQIAVFLLGFGLILICSFLPHNIAQALTVTPRVELSGDPGAVIEAEIKILNEERESKTFYLRTENFNAQDETGTPSFSQRREGLATWINAPLSITLGPGENITLPLQINIPANAEPGGHYAAVFFLTEPPGSAEESGAVGITSKLGSLVLLRVEGDFVQDANILEFGTKERQRFFSHLPIQFYYRFQNTGEDHLKPIGDVQITNIIGQTAKILVANPIDGSVLSKSVRRFTTVWSEKRGPRKQEASVDLPKADTLSYWDAANYQARNFAFGRYTASLELAFGTKELKSDRSEFVFYVVPWQLLSVVIPAMLVLLFILRILIKRYNRYIIRKAEERVMLRKQR